MERRFANMVELALIPDTRCDRCGAGLKFVAERVIGSDHVHREYECSGCLQQCSACSLEGFKLVQHVGH